MAIKISRLALWPLSFHSKITTGFPIGLRKAQKSLERGSPRSDCGWNLRDRNGDANIGLRKAQIPMSLNAGNEGPQSLRGLPRSGLKPS